MNVDHPDAEPRRGGNRAGDRVGDVVKLQVEEHPIAAGGELLDKAGSRAGEQAAADLESADGSPQTIRHRPRLGDRIDVKGDEKLFHVAPWLFELPGTRRSRPDR